MDIQDPLKDSTLPITPIDEKAFPPLFGGESATIGQSDKEIATRAKAFEPSVNTLITIIDGASVRAARNLLRQVVDEETAEEMAERVKFEEETRIGLKQASARIIARRCKSSEAVDWTVVAGAVADWGLGFNALAKEVAMMRRKLEVGNPGKAKPNEN